MKWKMFGMTLMAAFGVAVGSLFVAEKAVERVDTAAKVLDEVMGTPEHPIPRDLFNKSQCVAIIPGVKKAGLELGGAVRQGSPNLPGQGRARLEWPFHGAN
jgi:lipid-binding SYLF domain-containing protein